MIEKRDSVDIYNEVKDLQNVPIKKYNKLWVSRLDILKILYDGNKDAVDICNTLVKELEED